jgi:hypothetical protein
MSWWVVNHPIAGPRQAMMTRYEIVQSASPPVNKIAGPFGTKQEALDWQTSANTAGNSPGSAVGGAVNVAKKAVTGWTHNIEQWIIRAFEMILGAGLIIVALAKLASDTPAGRAAMKIATKAALL